MTARPRAVIIGMMGAGKTRVGKEVAHMLRLPFADADVEIEREVGMKIPSYFEEYGEPAFREVEADLIADMLEDFDGIFSLVGSADDAFHSGRIGAVYRGRRQGRVSYGRS